MIELPAKEGLICNKDLYCGGGYAIFYDVIYNFSNMFLGDETLLSVTRSSVKYTQYKIYTRHLYKPPVYYKFTLTVELCCNFYNCEVADEWNILGEDLAD